MEKKRIAEIDILRGIAGVLMILGHSFIEHPVNISGISWCVSLRHFIYTFHMELFFILAGAVYHCSAYCSFIRKKAKRLIVPYLFFGVTTLLLRVFGGSLINGNEKLGDGIYSLVFQGGAYWFLYVLFLTFLLYPLLEKVFKTDVLKIALITISIVLWRFVDLPNVFAIDTIFYYLPFFIAGNMLVRIVRDLELRKIWYFAVISLIVFCALDWWDVHASMDALLKYPRAMAIIIALFVLAKGLIWLSEKWKVVYGARLFLEDCSRYSLQLYLFNGYILTVIRTLLCRIMGITEPIVIVLAIWLGNLVLTLIACKWIIPRIPLVRRLCGL